ncbi:adenosyl cobinamide kinase/adenosyl cobinamide phosphate guanylyltransferase/NaMN:DMB phosphoribosyltransferase [Actinoplanes lutulentus]|uniref:Adenosylcobinamide kinase n=1 Tax=Actinoplanes lutulentus TaxID=1287878 RepID=A0A327ZG85_9ACTN|nr:bifunctional adenosylcobinamide kinase/adenosylcobinamide-phosphate guanylyltransferase [Actinoplanes lutulentus]MBB2941748.1 adenosyl cobinamide kinase/adenosyl cobinamide phosphate guanylyltransferase/NaMN:DMB phosphoribosyltransferase [Actinoplanes lutulentus]RAK39668.1 adenosylcobinamide kinase /adenosylcobinamide-phosphate guanylyltransferase [Actinoplanes lutulentus]
MSEDRWNTVLVLGGIRSGKSAFAESLVADAPSVRYVATAIGGEDDPEWLARIEAHQRRRPQSWSTEETGPDPTRLTALLTEAKQDETLLVDDLGGWVAAVLDPARQPNDDEADVAALAEAVRGCAARVVLVSPEVGLSLVPVTPIGRAFADALGVTNQALASACDGVALVVAGQTTWLKREIPAERLEPKPAQPVAAATPAPPPPPVRTPVVVTPAKEEPAEEEPTANLSAALSGATMTLPLIYSGLTEIAPGMDLPLPSSDAGPDARERLGTLDLPGAGIGALAEAVEFAAATQDTTTPRPWSAVRVVLIAGGHEGDATAGSDLADIERRVTEAELGTGLLGRLAGEAGADISVLRAGAAGAMEDGPVTGDETVEASLRQGWQLADAAADAGKDAIVLAGLGAGLEAVATAVLSATTGAEPVAMLPRVLVPGGRYDDHAWMVRCAAVRDALHRIRQEPRGANDILRELGGPALAVATGVLLGAAARRIPVLLDGPLGIAAGLVARDLASQTRHWCLLPEAGTLALVKQGADVLGLTPVLQIGLDLGEGANALAVLPALRTAIGLASILPVHPGMMADHEVV